ncbi:response regulator [Flavobacterium limi]|uniref:Two-component system response regulator n=1 Tax=Flavobacterium limi TaxID=2045105 RepID=A0ABQ1UZM5_9FLAO|nr:response regulator [Flavobacterium limi]GGF29530.1 two-component system response regulator [Flavobacterium limi]
MGLISKHTLRSIFIADDDSDDRTFFAEALAEVNSEILLTEFEDGLQLMNILTQPGSIIPDIIFLDINMPKYDGMQCLEIIRRSKNTLADTPVIILSTSSNSETIQKAYNLGANHYAVKPGSFNEIKFFLHSVLKMDWNFRTTDPDAFRLI